VLGNAQRTTEDAFNITSSSVTCGGHVNAAEDVLLLNLACSVTVFAP
jgi:hypothetical protein